MNRYSIIDASILSAMNAAWNEGDIRKELERFETESELESESESDGEMCHACRRIDRETCAICDRCVTCCICDEDAWKFPEVDDMRDECDEAAGI